MFLVKRTFIALYTVLGSILHLQDVLRLILLSSWDLQQAWHLPPSPCLAFPGLRPLLTRGQPQFLSRSL